MRSAKRESAGLPAREVKKALFFLIPVFLISIREWDCPECGSHNDRDINASINILAAGGAVSAPVAHGGNSQDRAGLSVERL
ncbi:zinc ribbon domain-containing protein [Okeania sp. KiyG1]|uniref:zinc ribbon domain-containing protein n=1 Tax=Okeania sp. KiyG1 TaxID=2720165 RepID=UPI0035C8E043